MVLFLLLLLYRFDFIVPYSPCYSTTDYHCYIWSFVVCLGCHRLPRRCSRCMPRVPPSNCVFSPPFPGFDDLHFWMARLLFWSCIGEIDVLPVCSLSCFSCVFGSRRPGWLVMLVLPGQKF